MTIKHLLLSIFIFSSICCCAQKFSEDHLFKASIIFPGVGYEKGIGKKSSLALDAHTPPLLNVLQMGETNVYLAALLRINAQYRFYYNFKARKALDRNYAGNSANYIALGLFAQKSLGILSGKKNNWSVNRDWLPAASAAWGIQRLYGERWLLNAEFGINYWFALLSQNGNHFAPRINFSFSYLLFRKHK